MSQSVLADAQFGVARILRPYSAFAYGVDLPYSQASGAFPALPAQVPAPGITIEAGGPFFLNMAPNFAAVLVNAIGGVGGVGGQRMVAIPGYGIFAFIGYNEGTGQIELLSLAPTAPCSPFVSNYSGDVAEGTWLTITLPGGYNGYPGSMPIMFSEGGLPFDDLVTKPGYSSMLLRGIPTPMGARILVWLPRLVPYPDATCIAEPTAPVYQWEFSFRLRNLNDFNNNRMGYHLASSKQGAPSYGEESTAASSFDPRVRVPIPAADHVVIYNGLEPPASPLVRVVTQRVLKEGFQTTSGRDLLPLVPGKLPRLTGAYYEWPSGSETYPGQLAVEGFGVYQQGVVSNLSAWPPSFPNSADSTQYYGYGAYSPLFDILEIQCPGDEMLVSLTKVSGSTPNWAFPQLDPGFPPEPVETPAEDLAIVQAFCQGYEFSGVYVLPGSAP